MTTTPDIRQLRLERGWSQRYLSERAGVAQGDISKLENGASLRARVLSALLAPDDDLSTRK
jgi:transcriptional regulator with XRE-family HTH domain